MENLKRFTYMQVFGHKYHYQSVQHKSPDYDFKNVYVFAIQDNKCLPSFLHIKSLQKFFWI